MVVVASTVDTIVEWTDQLLALAVKALDTTPAKAPARRLTASSTPAIDCELVCVVLEGIGADVVSPSSPPTAIGHQYANQGYLILAAMTVTWARCAPTPKTVRKIPSAAAISEFANQLNRDLWALWNAIASQMEAGELFNGSCAALYIDPPTPLEEAGGFAGWNLTVRPAIGGYRPELEP